MDQVCDPNQILTALSLSDPDAFLMAFVVFVVVVVVAVVVFVLVVGAVCAGGWAGSF